MRERETAKMQVLFDGKSR